MANNKVLNPSFRIPVRVALNMQGRQVFNVAAPTDSDDAVTLTYLNEQLRNLPPSDSELTYSISFDTDTRVLTLTSRRNNVVVDTDNVVIPGGSGGSNTAGYGIIISGSTISVDTETIADTDWVIDYVNTHSNIVPQWNATTAYLAGNLVVYVDNDTEHLYRAANNNTGLNPSNNAAAWTRFSGSGGGGGITYTAGGGIDINGTIISVDTDFIDSRIDTEILSLRMGFDTEHRLELRRGTITQPVAQQTTITFTVPTGAGFGAIAIQELPLPSGSDLPRLQYTVTQALGASALAAQVAGSLALLTDEYESVTAVGNAVVITYPESVAGTVFDLPTVVATGITGLSGTATISRAAVAFDPGSAPLIDEVSLSSLVTEPKQLWHIGPDSDTDSVRAGVASGRLAVAGPGAIASGIEAHAWGHNSTATGDNSQAYGVNVHSTGAFAAGIGRDLVTDGFYSGNVGGQNTIKGDRSVAIGAAITITDSDTFAVGSAITAPVRGIYIGNASGDTDTDGNSANAIHNILIGSGTEDLVFAGAEFVGSARKSVAIGTGTVVGDSDTTMREGMVAIGKNVRVRGDHSVGIGCNIEFSGTDEIRLGGNTPTGVQTVSVDPAITDADIDTDNKLTHKGYVDNRDITAATWNAGSSTLTLAREEGDLSVTIAGGGGGGGSSIVIEEDGNGRGTAATVNFTGNAVSVSQANADSEVTVTIVDSDTTYSFTQVGNTLQVTGGEYSSTAIYTPANLPDSDTTYSLSGAGARVDLVGSDGTTSSYTVTGLTPANHDSDAIILSTQPWVSADTDLATTAAIDGRIHALSELKHFNLIIQRNYATGEGWNTGDQVYVSGAAFHPQSLVAYQPNIAQYTGNNRIRFVFNDVAQLNAYRAEWLLAGRRFARGANREAEQYIQTVFSYNNETIEDSFPLPNYRGLPYLDVGLTTTVNTAWQGIGGGISFVYFYDDTDASHGVFEYTSGTNNNNAMTVDADWSLIHTIDTDGLRRLISENTARLNAQETQIETNRDNIAILNNGDAYSVKGRPGSTSGSISNIAVGADEVLGRAGTGDLGGTQVQTNMLADGAVHTAKIGDTQVTNAKLADNAVSSGKISDNAVTNSKINNGAVTTDKIGDAQVTAAKLAPGVIPSLPNGAHVFDRDSDGLVPHPGADAGTPRYLSDAGTWTHIDASHVTGGGRFITDSDTPSTYADSAGDYVRVNSDTDALEFFDPFPIAAATGRMTVINGLTLRSIDTTSGSPALVFAHWEWQSPTLSLDDSDTNAASSATMLHWDSPFQGVDFSYPNHSDLPGEFVSQILAVGMFDGSNQIWSDRSYGPFAHATPLTTEFRDSEVYDTNLQGRANGASGRSLELRGRMRNNTFPTVSDQSFTFDWSWGPVGFTGSTISVTGLSSTEQNFDLVLGGDISAVFQAEATHSMSNITPSTSAIHVVHSDGASKTYAQQGSLTANNTNDTLSGTYSADTETVYWHSAVVSAIAASFVRPTGIQVDTDLASRTANINIAPGITNTGSAADQPFRINRRTPLYPVWKVESTAETFSTTLLGTLSNSGYATAAELAYSSNMNLVAQGSAHTYTATNSTSTERYMHVVAKYVSGRTLTYREVTNPALPVTVTPVRTDNNVALGHTTNLAAADNDAQRFEVITFAIPANSTINIQIS